MIKFKDFLQISENMDYHIKLGIPVSESVFRVHSPAYYELIHEARKLYESGIDFLSESDKLLYKHSDFGLFESYEGNLVPLDCPYMLSEEEHKELNKPKRGGPKKFYVFVKDPSTGNIKKVTFGDTTGLSVKFNNLAARKSFAARHQCSTQNDKTSAAYWACRLPHYAKQLGLSGGGNFFW
jgi:hypothetical protein